MLKAESFTVDAFHRGRFHLFQRADKGHRAGLDAMLLAAAVPDGFSGLLADLGAGSGAAGFAVASRCKNANVLLVERSPEMAECAQKSIVLPENTVYASRIAFLQADVETSGRQRVLSGLADNRFNFVIMNPPFNGPHDRASPDSLRRDAHVMTDGLLERWTRSAAAIAAANAGFAVIARAESLYEVLAACAGRFGSAEIRPIHPRPKAAAIRIVLRARKGARGMLKLLPPLMLHAEEGRDFSPEANAVINGERDLFSA